MWREDKRAVCSVSSLCSQKSEKVGPISSGGGIAPVKHLKSGLGTTSPVKKALAATVGVPVFNLLIQKMVGEPGSASAALETRVPGKRDEEHIISRSLPPSQHLGAVLEAVVSSLMAQQGPRLPALGMAQQEPGPPVVGPEHSHSGVYLVIPLPNRCSSPMQNPRTLPLLVLPRILLTSLQVHSGSRSGISVESTERIQSMLRFARPGDSRIYSPLQLVVGRNTS